MTEETTKKSWWGTMPGVLTALAATITAVGSLVAVLSQSGLIGEKAREAVASVMPTAGHPQGASFFETTAPKVHAPATELTTPAATAHSPAEVLTDLKSREFKGIAVTHMDGSVVALAPGAEVAGNALQLSNGQQVLFERIVSVEIEQPWDGSATLELTNGQKLTTKLTNYNIDGKSALGPYRELLSNLRRIDFMR